MANNSTFSKLPSLSHETISFQQLLWPALFLLKHAMHIVFLSLQIFDLFSTHRRRRLLTSINALANLGNHEPQNARNAIIVAIILNGDKTVGENDDYVEVDFYFLYNHIVCKCVLSSSSSSGADPEHQYLYSTYVYRV